MTNEKKYDKIIELCSKSKSYYKHSFIRTKNGGKYLKIRTKKNTYFTDIEQRKIIQLVEDLAGKERTISTNNIKGTLSITFY